MYQVKVSLDQRESQNCDGDCTFVSCGDGEFNAAAGEECDDAGDSFDCDADCTVAECGDGYTKVNSDYVRE